jgi:hypothetical protein
MGVDAGGDAFALAQEMYTAAEVQKETTASEMVSAASVGLGGMLKRGDEQAARYESRIATQKIIIDHLKAKVLAYQEKYGPLDG